MRLKVSSAKRRPFCLSFNVLNLCSVITNLSAVILSLVISSRARHAWNIGLLVPQGQFVIFVISYKSPVWINNVLYHIQRNGYIYRPCGYINHGPFLCYAWQNRHGCRYLNEALSQNNIWMIIMFLRVVWPTNNWVILLNTITFLSVCDHECDIVIFMYGTSPIQYILSNVVTA